MHLWPRLFHFVAEVFKGTVLEFDLPRKVRHLFHATLIQLLKIYFQLLVLLVKSKVFLCLTQPS